jgi:hypothetical protein
VDEATGDLPKATTPLLRNPRKLARWRTALGKARFVQQGVTILGDSITFGGNSNDAAIVTDAEKVVATTRGWVSQLRDALAARLGIVAGEGFVWLKQTVTGITTGDPRWTYALAQDPGGAVGAYGRGRRLLAGNHATALDQRLSVVDVLGWSGGVSAHMVDIEIDDVSKRPTALVAHAKAGVVGAGKWQPRGSGTVVTSDGANGLNVERTTTDGTVVIDYGTNMPCVAGQWLAFTFTQIKAGTVRGGSAQVTFYDDANAQVGGTDQTVATRSSAAAAPGSTATGFIQVPVGATKYRATYRGANWVVGETATVKAFDVVPVDRITVTGSAGSSYSYESVPVALGNHKVRLVTAASDNCDVSGVIFRDRVDAGIVVNRLGLPGATTATVTANDTTPATDPTALDQRLGAVVKLPATAAPTPLLIIALGTNNPSNGISATDYRAQLKTITDYQTANGGCTLLVGGPRFADDTPNLDPYYAQALDLSNTDPHVAYIDINESWGGNAAATAVGFMAPALGIHPTLAGHGDYANIVDDTITRQIVTLAS